MSLTSATMTSESQKCSITEHRGSVRCVEGPCYRCVLGGHAQRRVSPHGRRMQARVELYEDATEKKAKAKKAERIEGPPDWVGKCWMVITASLHDDVYRKVNHVRRGAVATLLTEIQHALVVNNLEEVQPLRLELYGADAKGCWL